MKKFLILLFLMAIGTSAFAQVLNNPDGYITRYTAGTNAGSFYTNDGVFFVKYYYNSKSVLVKFPQYKNTTTYTVPDDVYIIAKGAFEGNKYIQTIRIPSTLTSIGDNAFDGCENLKNIEVYDASSAIPAVEMDEDIEKKEIGRYNINGVKVEEKDGGIQIILYSDGSAEKVLEQP